MLRWLPQAALEARTGVVRPSRLGFAEHLRMRRLGASSQALRCPAERSLEGHTTLVRPSGEHLGMRSAS
jgi:cell division inhibitor SulA